MNKKKYAQNSMAFDLKPPKANTVILDEVES